MDLLEWELINLKNKYMSDLNFTNLTDNQLRDAINTDATVASANKIYTQQKILGYASGLIFKDWIVKVNELYEKSNKKKERKAWLNEQYENYSKKSRTISFLTYVTRVQNIMGTGALLGGILKDVSLDYIENKLNEDKTPPVPDKDIKPEKDNKFLGMKPIVYIPVLILVAAGIGYGIYKLVKR